MAAWNTLTLIRSRIVFFIASAAVVAASACAPHTRSLVPAGTTDPDKFLFDKGTEALNKKKWLTAREFFKQVTETYTQSAFRPDAKLREAKDRLDESNYLVGFFYYRQRWYLGAADRFKAVLKEDPAFTKRDAVYFHLGESLIKQKKEAEALPYFEKLLQEFEQSEYLQEAQKRVAELKAQAQSK